MVSGVAPLTVGSTFTGIGGADLGLEWAGFRVAWQCEIDAWKRSVLAAHWPNTPAYEDITTLHDPPSVDVLIGGFPCQDLSVAGKRKGFSGERSVLAFEFLRVAEALRPRWLILENVPGLFSSNSGADFARLIDEVVGCGYGVAWRILDARYFGVPQRRRRVFIVARRADASGDTAAASRLALRALIEGGGGDLTPGWPPGPEITAASRRSAQNGRGAVTFNVYPETGNGADLAASPVDISMTLAKTWSERGVHVVEPVAYRKSKRAQTDQDDETWVADGAANTLNRFDVGDTRTTHLIPLNTQLSNQATPGGTIMHTLDKNANAGVAEITPKQTMGVRRLTPVECERLMGLPDRWTAPKGIKAPDTKRYAACGDAIVTWVAYWIGCRIQMIEQEANA